MKIPTITKAVCLTGLGTIAAAQDFNAQSFEEDVNNAISDMPGVSFTVNSETKSDAANAQTDIAIRRIWASHAAENAPEFGFVVNDLEGMPVDVFGENTPYQTLKNRIEITGYNLPEGFTVNTVGTAGYVAAVEEIAKRVEAPSNDVEIAVQTVKGASAYIVQELCSAVGRPTEITLNLTAGFQLAFSVETGSEFHWDLEVVCLR